MGNFGHFISNLKSPLTPNYMIPLKKLLDENFHGEMRQNNQYPFIPSVEEINDVFEYLNGYEDGLFLTPNMIYPVCYFKNFNYVDFNSLDINVLKFIDIKKQIESGNAFVQQCFEDNNFDLLFQFMDKKISFYVYHTLFEQIPDESKYKIFIDLYTRNEYGFSQLNHEFIKKIIKYQSIDYKQNVRKQLKQFVDKDGYLTIYRGMGSKSTPCTEALSWTKNLQVAMFFAMRFDKDGTVYESKVHLNDVIDYLENRDEAEILVLPQNLKEIQLFKSYETPTLLKELEEHNYLKGYSIMKDFILPSHYHNPYGIHGISHIQRVLFHTFTLSYLLKLSKEDEYILNQSAVLHDIGRVHDYEDELHGFSSYKKAVKLALIPDKGENLALIKYIVENHCIEDNRAYQNVKRYSILNKERAVRLLKVFKDADGLDRVRLGDLDTKYLRNTESIKLVNFAHYLLNTIE